jgi:hypothetical protein
MLPKKLAKLIDHLYVLEREYDKALEHAASYLGYDEKIEKVRDGLTVCTRISMKLKIR